MVFWENLLSDMENTEEIVEMIRQGKAVYDIYLLCVPKNSPAPLHILSTYEALKEVNRSCDYVVIGMEKGKEQAYNKAVELLGDWLKARGNLNGFKKFYIGRY